MILWTTKTMGKVVESIWESGKPVNYSHNDQQWRRVLENIYKVIGMLCVVYKSSWYSTKDY